MAFLLMFAFRAWVITIYTVADTTPAFGWVKGDRVLVNRWSYGLRSGGSRYFRYSRLFSSPIGRGDLIAFNLPLDSCANIAMLPVAIGKVIAIPGDTIAIGQEQYVIPQPSLICPHATPYCIWVQRHDGSCVLVREEYVIGKAMRMKNFFQSLKSLSYVSHHPFIHLFRTHSVVPKVESLRPLSYRALRPLCEADLS